MKSPSFRSLFLTSCLVLLAFCLSTLTKAATLNVPTTQYPTIQSAINAAANGDTVLVAAGTYSGPGNRDISFFGKSLTVTSQAGAGSTIIDCGGYASTDGTGNHRGFYINYGEKNAVISGLTIENGIENGSSSDATTCTGAGILIAGSYVTVDRCTIKNN